jgi:hypothetical protein
VLGTKLATGVTVCSTSIAAARVAKKAIRCSVVVRSTIHKAKTTYQLLTPELHSLSLSLSCFVVYSYCKTACITILPGYWRRLGEDKRKMKKSVPITTRFQNKTLHLPSPQVTSAAPEDTLQKPPQKVPQSEVSKHKAKFTYTYVYYVYMYNIIYIYICIINIYIYYINNNDNN